MAKYYANCAEVSCGDSCDDCFSKGCACSSWWTNGAFHCQCGQA